MSFATILWRLPIRKIAILLQTTQTVPERLKHMYQSTAPFHFYRIFTYKLDSTDFSLNMRNKLTLQEFQMSLI